MATCCENILKYAIFLLNFVFFLASVGLISIGAYLEYQKSTYLSFLDSPYLNTSIVLIIIGVVMLVVSFFGCCGACTENKCMLMTYATLLVLITLALIAVSIAIYVFKDDVKKVIQEQMKDGLKNYKEDGHVGVTQTWNMIQSDFYCCGVDSYKNWKDDSDFGKNGDVPDECCKTWKDGCGQGIGNQNENEAAKTIYTKGCFTSLEETIESNETTAIGFGVGVLFLLLIGVIIACCVGRSVGESRNYV